jgi:hypothetical protein
LLQSVVEFSALQHLLCLHFFDFNVSVKLINPVCGGFCTGEVQLPMQELFVLPIFQKLPYLIAYQTSGFDFACETFVEKALKEVQTVVRDEVLHSDVLRNS